MIIKLEIPKLHTFFTVFKSADWDMPRAKGQINFFWKEDAAENKEIVEKRWFRKRMGSKESAYTWSCIFLWHANKIWIAVMKNKAEKYNNSEKKSWKISENRQKKWRKNGKEKFFSCIQEFFYIICWINHGKFCIIEIHIQKVKRFLSKSVFPVDFLSMVLQHKR